MDVQPTNPKLLTTSADSASMAMGSRLLFKDNPKVDL